MAPLTLSRSPCAAAGRAPRPPPARAVGNDHLGEYRPYGPFYQEHKMHFALWALMKSPLMVGHDLRSINQSSLDLLLKKVGGCGDAARLGLAARLHCRDARV